MSTGVRDERTNHVRIYRSRERRRTSHALASMEGITEKSKSAGGPQGGERDKRVKEAEEGNQSAPEARGEGETTAVAGHLADQKIIVPFGKRGCPATRQRGDQYICKEASKKLPGYRHHRHMEEEEGNQTATCYPPPKTPPMSAWWNPYPARGYSGKTASSPQK